MGGPDGQFKNYIHKIFNRYIFHETECIQDFVSANSLVFDRTAFVAVSESGCTALETIPGQVNLIIINQSYQSYQSYQYLKNKLVMLGSRHGLITNLIKFTTLLLDLGVTFRMSFNYLSVN